MKFNPSASRSAALISLCGIVAGFSGCENLNTDVKPTPEYGFWQVDHYQALNAGLLNGSSDAAKICSYNGTPVMTSDGPSNVVWMTITGTATAQFRKNGSNNFLAKVDGRSVRFANEPAGYMEEKGTSELPRQIQPTIGVTYHNIRITAGNENGVNIIPRTDFVVASHDYQKGLTKLAMTDKRERRYVRIRTDYLGREEYTDANGYRTYRVVLLTDLYQVDCGSSAARPTGQPTLEKIAQGVPVSELTKRGEESTFDYSAYRVKK